ncbi:hypothetical protein Taro_050409, partial [Colocasia esculenta]|nr:hypothetical protein [Colocasia esculenta]
DTSVDTTWASVNTLSQNSLEGVLGRPLVSTLLELVSTHCPRLARREGVVESTSDEENEEFVVPAARASDKGKDVAPDIPLLTRRVHHSSKKKKLKVNMKLVIERLEAHGEILCSLQNEVSSIFVSQSTGAKQVGALKAELQSLKGELGSIKQLVQGLSIFVRAHLPIPAPPAPTPAGSLGPSGPSVEDVRPLGPVDAEHSGPSGPRVEEEAVVGPSGPKIGEESRPSEE